MKIKIFFFTCIVVINAHFALAHFRPKLDVGFYRPVLGPSFYGPGLNLGFYRPGIDLGFYRPPGLGFGLVLGGVPLPCFINGGGYGGVNYDSGTSGYGFSGFHNAGASGFHNIGTHHNKVTTINNAENSGFHNIGGGSAVQNDGVENSAVNQFQNGGSQFGNNGFNS